MSVIGAEAASNRPRLRFIKILRPSSRAADIVENLFRFRSMPTYQANVNHPSLSEKMRAETAPMEI
jgi:hypothetical protein